MYPSQNFDGKVLSNNGFPLKIGCKHTSGYYSGYLAEFYALDGQATGPEFFAETNSATDQWQPKEPTDIKQAVTFGNNGFYLPFSIDALATSFTSDLGDFAAGGGSGGGRFVGHKTL